MHNSGPMAKHQPTHDRAEPHNAGHRASTRPKGLSWGPRPAFVTCASLSRPAATRPGLRSVLPSQVLPRAATSLRRWTWRSTRRKPCCAVSIPATCRSPDAPPSELVDHCGPRLDEGGRPQSRWHGVESPFAQASSQKHFSDSPGRQRIGITPNFPYANYRLD